MRPGLAPGDTFTDYEFSDHQHVRRGLSDIQGDDPMILTLARGAYCPKEVPAAPRTRRLVPQIAVACTAAAGVVATVFVEETPHPTLAAILLDAVGGTPVLDAPHILPSYPARVPHADTSFEIAVVPFGSEALDLRRPDAVRAATIRWEIPGTRDNCDCSPGHAARSLHFSRVHHRAVEESRMWQRREVWAAVVCLAVGSAGQLAQFLVTPVSSAGSAMDNVAAAAAASGRMEAAAWLDLTILFLVPALVVVGALAGARTTRLGWVATVIAVATTLPGVAYVLAPDAMYAAGVPASAITAYTENAVVGAATIVFLLGHVVGLLLLGIALVRADRVPRWAGVCLAISPFAEIGGTAAGVGAVALVGYLLLLAAFGACAAALTRTPSGRMAQAATPDVAAAPSSGH